MKLLMTIPKEEFAVYFAKGSVCGNKCEKSKGNFEEDKGSFAIVFFIA